MKSISIQLDIDFLQGEIIIYVMINFLQKFIKILTNFTLSCFITNWNYHQLLENNPTDCFPLTSDIMKILEELFYGNVDETSRRIDETLKAKRKKEIELSNELMNLLPEKERPKFEKLMIMIDDNYAYELKDKYIQGVKTGILIGVESSQIEL